MAARKVITEQLELGPGFRRAYTVSLFTGGIAMAAAIIVAYFGDPSFRRFYFAYLVSFMFFLSISLGAVMFVLLQYLTRAGWSVAVRRVAETLGCALPVLAALSAPIVISVILQKGDLYRWAVPAHSAGLDPLTIEKRAYLNPGFFLIRLFVYFAIWSAIGLLYWRWSVQQDETRDEKLTHRMQVFSAPAMILMFVTLTLAAFDLIMSLDPTWSSTIFGVYFFAGCAVSIFAALIVILVRLQRSGCLTETVTNDHYHDLGKFLFAFTFFWGYIAFSQYMLLWYGAIPEEVGWFARRGATTVREDINGWTPVNLVLLFGHLIIPFAGLMSRHAKRRGHRLVFWAIWLLVFHWLDLHWMIMPEYDGKFHLGLLELLCFVGIGGIYLATLLRIGLRHHLRPIADPRLEESLAFENV